MINRGSLCKNRTPRSLFGKYIRVLQDALALERYLSCPLISCSDAECVRVVHTAEDVTRYGRADDAPLCSRNFNFRRNGLPGRVCLPLWSALSRARGMRRQAPDKAKLIPFRSTCICGRLSPFRVQANPSGMLHPLQPLPATHLGLNRQDRKLGIQCIPLIRPTGPDKATPVIWPILWLSQLRPCILIMIGY